MIELAREAAADPEARRLLNDPYTLTPDRSAEPELGAQPDARWRRGRDIAPELDGYWVGAFAMAVPNTRIVRRSNALLGYAYGRRFEYAEQMSVGRSIVAPVAAAMGDRGQRRRGSSSPAASSTASPNRLLERILPKPGTGPSERTREQGPLHRRDVHHHVDRCARYGATDVPAGRPGLQSDLGACSVRAGWRSRWTATNSLTSMGAHSGSGDGRCAAGPIPRRRCSLETSRLS